jgi:hypothetical protein
MTNKRPATYSGAMRHVPLIALLLTGVLVQSCAPGADGGPAGSRLRVYAADVAGGAKVCIVPRLTPTAGQTGEATIKVGNDGGWCGVPVRQSTSKPFDAGLLTARPAHGNVLIHQVGDDTRLDYTPDRGFTGADAFSVKLLPGGVMVHVAVTVTSP